MVWVAGDYPTWGYRRIRGEIVGLGHRLAPSTVWQILENHHIDPAPGCSAVTLTEFLRPQATVAGDFATIDAVTLRRYYLRPCAASCSTATTPTAPTEPSTRGHRSLLATPSARSRQLIPR